MNIRYAVKSRDTGLFYSREGVFGSLEDALMYKFLINAQAQANTLTVNGKEFKAVRIKVIYEELN